MAERRELQPSDAPGAGRVRPRRGWDLGAVGAANRGQDRVRDLDDAPAPVRGNQGRLRERSRPPACTRTSSLSTGRDLSQRTESANVLYR